MVSKFCFIMTTSAVRESKKKMDRREKETFCMKRMTLVKPILPAPPNDVKKQVALCYYLNATISDNF